MLGLIKANGVPPTSPSRAGEILVSNGSKAEYCPLSPHHLPVAQFISLVDQEIDYLNDVAWEIGAPNYDAYDMPLHPVILLSPTTTDFQTALANGYVDMTIPDSKTWREVTGEHPMYVAVVIFTGVLNLAGRVEYYAHDNNGDYLYAGDMIIKGYSDLGVPDGKYPIELHCNWGSGSVRLYIAIS